MKFSSSIWTRREGVVKFEGERVREVMGGGCGSAGPRRGERLLSDKMGKRERDVKISKDLGDAKQLCSLLLRRPAAVLCVWRGGVDDLGTMMRMRMISYWCLSNHYESRPSSAYFSIER